MLKDQEPLKKHMKISKMIGLDIRKLTALFSRSERSIAQDSLSLTKSRSRQAIICKIYMKA